MNICNVLVKSGNLYIPYTRDIEREMEKCLNALGMNRESFAAIKEHQPIRYVRVQLRKDIFIVIHNQLASLK